MGRGKRHDYSFADRQKAMLAALLIVAVFDIAASGIFIRRIGIETTEQMRMMTSLHTSLVYEECDRAAYDMRRLLMENTDMTAMAQRGSQREKIYAKGNLIDRISYSLETGKRIVPFLFRKHRRDSGMFRAGSPERERERSDGPRH